HPFGGVRAPMVREDQARMQSSWPLAATAVNTDTAGKLADARKVAFETFSQLFYRMHRAHQWTVIPMSRSGSRRGAWRNRRRQNRKQQDVLFRKARHRLGQARETTRERFRGLVLSHGYEDKCFRAGQALSVPGSSCRVGVG